MPTIPLAEALLRRKELNQKVAQLQPDPLKKRILSMNEKSLESVLKSRAQNCLKITGEILRRQFLYYSR